MPEANSSAKAGPTQLSFFQAIFANMKETPDVSAGNILCHQMLNCLHQVDWVTVAATAGYNSASTARTRFGQIRRELLKGDGLAEPKSPTKPRAKKSTVKNAIGSGTNLSPSKVSKSIPMRGRSKSVGGKPGRGPKGKICMEEDDEEEVDEMEGAGDPADEMEM